MLSKEEVKHIADLSRLELSEKEIEKMQKDLSEILDYFNLLKKVDTTDVKLDDGEILPIEKVTRKDEAKPQSKEVVEALIQAAPDKKDDYIKVKAIL
jgi:aspartyl-tRNA(Asn)/glutamyl-tRNA(Gln) amidotransferase subunit C